MHGIWLHYKHVLLTIFLSFHTTKCQSRWVYTLRWWFSGNGVLFTSRHWYKFVKVCILSYNGCQKSISPSLSHLSLLQIELCHTECRESSTQMVKAWRKLCWSSTRQLLSVSSTVGWALVPYGTLQGLKRSSTSTQAAKRLEAYMGLNPVLLP